MEEVDKNKNIHPGDDFYNYINYDWIKNNPIPDDKNRWGQFNILTERNKSLCKELIVNAKKSLNPEFNKAGILYEQGIDMESRNKNNDYLVYLDQIQNISNKDELTDYFYNFSILHQISLPFSIYSYSDFDNSKNNILHLFSSGLILPDKDYYFLESKSIIRDKFKKFISEYCKLYNFEIDTNQIFNFLKNLAEVTYSRTEKRNPLLKNNKTNIDDFNKEYPNIKLNKLFDKINKNPGIINVTNPKYIKKLDEMISNISLNVWKQYLTLSFLLSIGNYLGEDKEKKIFDFFSKTLSGTEKMEPLWKRSLLNVHNQVGMIIGKMFVTKYFDEESKSIALKIINFIKNELRERLKNNDWMEDETKLKAVAKIDKMNVKIGYPDVWKNYSNLILSENNTYLKNNLLTNKFEVEYNFSELYQEKDPNKWFMSPAEVNAYYSPTYNEIVFPAGILQKPFFSKDYDIEYNFGGIGSVIGHEMTHGFDDQGRKYDEKGNLNNWWSDNDKIKYNDKTKKLEEQFNNYEIEGENINGKLTLGENIADLGGVSISLKALNKYLGSDYTDEQILESKRKFFINYAIIWRCNTRKEEIKKRIIEDPHSPPIYRVNGVVTNIPDFYDVFNLTEKNNLWKKQENIINIW